MKLFIKKSIKPCLVSLQQKQSLDDVSKFFKNTAKLDTGTNLCKYLFGKAFTFYLYFIMARLKLRLGMKLGMIHSENNSFKQLCFEELIQIYSDPFIVLIIWLLDYPIISSNFILGNNELKLTCELLKSLQYSLRTLTMFLWI